MALMALMGIIITILTIIPFYRIAIFSSPACGYPRTIVNNLAKFFYFG
jgi:hypothetical protein